MESFHTIIMDKNKPEPLYLQLGKALGEMIETGMLPPNSKLPPIRSLAQKLKVNNVTVVGAYQYLRSKGVVYSQVGSGTYVSPLPIDKLPPLVPVQERTLVEEGFEMSMAINFANTSLPHVLFPTEQFKEAFECILDKEAGGAFGYVNPAGFLPLREMLCTYLEDYGIQTSTEAIQILSGGQQGIDIVSRAMMTFGDIVFVESPTFYGAVGAFSARGCRVIEIEMEQDGMNLELLEGMMKMYRPKFLYAMAYFQTPTGISYSMDKKRRILSLCERYDVTLIEDDTLYDFCYNNQRITPFKALDYKNRVVYIKSFSKILMPGLRIGFMVIPRRFWASVASVRGIMDVSAGSIIQKALEYYLRTWGWQGHTEYIREYGAKRYETAVTSAKGQLGDLVQYALPGGGISLWIQLKKGLSASEITSRLLLRGVVVSPGSQYDTTPKGDSSLRLCFAGLTDEEIKRGFQIIGETLKGV